MTCLSHRILYLITVDPPCRPRPLASQSLYLALHPHGTHAWGRWVGMSYDGQVVSGWGSLARTEGKAHDVVQDLIEQKKSP